MRASPNIALALLVSLVSLAAGPTVHARKPKFEDFLIVVFRFEHAPDDSIRNVEVFRCERMPDRREVKGVLTEQEKAVGIQYVSQQRFRRDRGPGKTRYFALAFDLRVRRFLEPKT